jgi:protein arginine kinase activator
VKCQFCSSNEATVHLTNIVENHKQELHLCSACAESQKLIKKQELNLSFILQNVLGQQLGSQNDELARLTCPGCGIKYMEFRAQGRLGCPHDYNVFHNGLIPLLRRIHRSVHHVGKVPRHGPPDPDQQAEIMDLRRRLHQAVDAEAYEEAAQLRDLLRKKEATDESG